MARFLGGAALVLLGVANADVVLSSVVAGTARRRHFRSRDAPLFPNLRSDVVDASRALLSAVVLRASPLCGERLRAAERGIARALADDGAASAGADLRLHLALLAARDGRFDEAMRLYGEVARDDPSDPRPKALGHVLLVQKSGMLHYLLYGTNENLVSILV
ncbi:hypothetical protein BAE44_0022454 [Dichanthelium oligosanthes]|uniref:Uncharacterized protein n=1 Tax=Dichanthelium oligosanthes TaxID=888268 RepID=A0A1E5UUE5_9POAL|nr:hypothetical protein BAE44_0022454 [Dichanthelium oligosanthes]